jgi:bis(5'-nucleosidyl)-tetraphosphatase
MIIEKSSGAVVCRKQDLEIQFLSVKSKANLYWGFPKGRMENGESEEETAKREVLEETGLKVTLIDNFRTRIEYSLSENRFKEVILFIGKTLDDCVNIQQEEIEEFKWLNYDDMFELLTFVSDRRVLSEVNNFLKNLSDKYSEKYR